MKDSAKRKFPKEGQVRMYQVLMKLKDQIQLEAAL
jgi:hypothetical protein